MGFHTCFALRGLQYSCFGAGLQPLPAQSLTPAQSPLSARIETSRLMGRFGLAGGVRESPVARNEGRRSEQQEVGCTVRRAQVTCGLRWEPGPAQAP